MKANELSCKDLMVGDWVSYHGIVNKVAPADFCQKAWIDEIEPIPLTPEILEKNGWEEKPTGYVFYTDGKRYDNSLWYVFCSNTFVVNTAEFQIKYVHQLQHALKLCGIDKEIVV